MLTITHTTEAGTLLEGTSRGDGSAEVVKRHGWRWGRSIASWYVPQSRERSPRRDKIETTAAALREAGFEVEVVIDATVGDVAEAEARRAERAEGRAERLTARAQREQAAGEARDTAANQISDGIPFGQPILIGHHSQRRAERDRDRLIAHTRAGIEHRRAAEEASISAAIAAAAMDRRNAPVTVANRIQRLAASVRKMERSMTRMDRDQVAADAPARVQLGDDLAHERANLAHWQEVRAHQIAAGMATNYDRTTVKKGDAVKIRGTWHRVARANPTTVAVETPYSWTDKSPWHEVQDHAPAGEPIPF